MNSVTIICLLIFLPLLVLASPPADHADKVPLFRMLDKIQHELDYEQQTVKQVNASYKRLLKAYDILVNDDSGSETLASIKFNHSEPYDLGNVPIGSVKKVTIEIVNTGDTDAKGFKVADLQKPLHYVGGYYPGVGGTCVSELSKGATCTLELLYAGGKFNRSSKLKVKYNNGLKDVEAQLNVIATSSSPAVLTISEVEPYNFGAVAIGGRSEVELIVVNSGGGDAYGMSGSGLSLPFSFKGGSYPGTGGDCSSVLASGEVCVIVIDYKPTATGMNSDIVTIDYLDGIAGNTVTRGVQGIGVSPGHLTISEVDPYDFLSVPAGGQLDHTFVITNIGGSILNSISGSGLTLPFQFKGGTYPGVGGNCGLSLSPGGSCDLVIEYSPLVISSSDVDAVDLTYNDGVATLTSTRLLHGASVAPAALAITGSDPYDFGSVSIGTTSIQTFTITNFGDYDATQMLGLGLHGDFSFEGGSFPGTTGDCSANLPGGSACDVVVEFSPTKSGVALGAIDVTYYNGVITESITRDLEGSGISPAVLSISDGPGFNYGNLALGSSKEHTFTVVNTGGSEAYNLKELGLSAPFFMNGGYPGVGGTCSSALLPSKSCQIVVSFQATSTGVMIELIKLSYSDGSSHQTTERRVTGTGVHPAMISLSPSPIDFGKVTMGEYKDLFITVTNSGGFLASDLSAMIAKGPFQFKGGVFPGNNGTCVGTLASYASCLIEVRFAPDSGIEAQESLTFNYYDGVITQATTIDLFGDGIKNYPPKSPTAWDWKLIGIPEGSTSNNNSPTLRASLSNLGLSDFKYIDYDFEIYLDSICVDKIAVVTPTSNTVDISLEHMGDGSDDGLITYSARSIDEDGNWSVCVQVASYILDTQQGVPSVLSISDGPLYDFGNVRLGTAVKKVFTVFVSGELAIEEISIEKFQNSNYYFEGGFPGYGGTCQLQINSACTIVVSFWPSDEKKYNDKIIISYKSGPLITKAKREIVGQGTID